MAKKYTWRYRGMVFDNQNAKLYAAGVRDVPRMIGKDGDIWGRAGCYLKITRNPDKMSYYYGDALDLTGIQVMLICPEQGARDVTELCAFDPADGETLTDKNVKVTFTENETTLKTRLRLDVNWPENVTASGGWWTLYDNGLLHIYCVGDMPSGARWGDYWDKYRSSINTVILADSVTSVVDYVFDNFSNLTSIRLSNNLTSIGNSAFEYSGITSVNVPDSMMSIGYGAFHLAWRLTSVYIPHSVTSIGAGAFSGCYKLTAIDIPDSVISIGNNAFASCTRLTTITIPDSVTSIGNRAFSHCESLASIHIPDSVTYIGGTEFLQGAVFTACTSLESIHIPEGVKDMGPGMFQACTNLKSIYIPKSLKTVGSSAFSQCSALRDVYYGGTEADWRMISIYNYNNNALTSATIHYNSTGLDDA